MLHPIARLGAKAGGPCVAAADGNEPCANAVRSHRRRIAHPGRVGPWPLHRGVCDRRSGGGTQAHGRAGSLIARYRERSPVRVRRRGDGLVTSLGNARLASTAAAWVRSAVTWPSVKRCRMPESSARPSCERPRRCHSRVRLVAARNSQATAPCRRATSRDRWNSASAASAAPGAAVRQQPFALCPVDLGLAPAGLAAVGTQDRRGGQKVSTEKVVKVSSCSAPSVSEDRHPSLRGVCSRERYAVAQLSQYASEYRLPCSASVAVMQSAAASSPLQSAIGIAATPRAWHSENALSPAAKSIACPSERRGLRRQTLHPGDPGENDRASTLRR